MPSLLRAPFVWSIAATLALPFAHTYAAQPAKPNVLFIAVDDLNHWVGHLGRNPQTKTPNIDRLARMGVTFRNAYCAVPACEPARGALMGGRRPWTTGLYYNGDKWKTILPEGQGLTVPFLQAGYRVSGAGKIYHGDQYFPSEWTNLAAKPEFARTKVELAKWLPTQNAPHKGAGRADAGDEPAAPKKKARKKAAR